MDKYNHLFDCNLVLKTNNSSYFVLNSNYLNVTNSTMFREKKKVFSSCLSLSTYYRVLQVGSVTKDVENTVPAHTLQGMTTTCVEKIKQETSHKLRFNSAINSQHTC